MKNVIIEYNLRWEFKIEDLKRIWLERIEDGWEPTEPMPKTEEEWADYLYEIDDFDIYDEWCYLKDCDC